MCPTKSADVTSQLEAWLRRDPDTAMCNELVELHDSGNDDALAERFAGRLQFGTAGLRGIVGAGPMRMNRLVVRETSAGLAAYLIETIPDAAARGVVVAYDARPDSRTFAQDTASVLLGAGFRVYLTDDCQPTPVGAFAVLHHGAAAGVVVTASHNPPEYNGYKVYWENGAQIIPPHDAGIAACIDAAATSDIPWRDLDDAGDKLKMLGDAQISEYCDAVSEQCIAFRADRVEPITIAYTAMHGVGAKLAERLSTSSGICNFNSVASQHQPDGAFPTVSFPNPEEPGAMDAVIELARNKGALLACANDPDADRLAVAARNANSDYVSLTGDQVGVLLGDYLLGKPQDKMPIVCASLVSSRMLGAIAKNAGAVYFETLTGFKWLANVALLHEDDAHGFLFAYEEALGYALGSIVPDKDGLSALLAFVQMTAELTAEGQTIFDRLEALYRKHGLYATRQQSIATHPGAASITASLRASLPSDIGGHAVASIADYESGEHRYVDGRNEAFDTHPADMLVFYLDDDSRVIVRPSGTEPKTKCYYEVITAIGGEFETAKTESQRSLDELVAAHQASLEELI